MGQPLTILHLLSYHLFTGPAEPVLNLARTQLEMGHMVSLATDTVRTGNIEEWAKSYGVPVDRRFALSVKTGPILLFRDLVMFKQLWTQDQVDILHAHRSHDHTLAALTRRRKSKTALVRTLHTEKSTGSSRDWQLKRADGVITVAKRFRDSLLKRRLLSEDRVISIEGCVDTERFCPGSEGSEVRRQAGVLEHAPVAGIVARMKPSRGHESLLKAWGKVVEKLPEARLMIAGRGEVANRLHDFASKQSWAETVIFLGYRKDLESVYRAFDLKVILAPGNDGTCRAALEAMATEVPVLASDKGALAEIIRDGQTGRVVSSGNTNALARVLVEMLSDRRRLKQMGERARQEASARFDRWKQAETVESLYRRLIDKRESGLVRGGRS